MALVGAIKIGEGAVEKPRLFSTFFIVVAIRPKSIHCPRYLSEYSSRPPLTRQEELRAVRRNIRFSAYLCQYSLYSEQPIARPPTQPFVGGFSPLYSAFPAK